MSTSIDAFIGSRSGAQLMRERVLERLTIAGEYGMTDDELQQLLEADSQSVTPARLTLERNGQLFWSGRIRATRDGYAAMVWVLPHFQHVPRRPDLDVKKHYCPACGRGPKPK